jgi:hypothetical protein
VKGKNKELKTLRDSFLKNKIKKTVEKYKKTILLLLLSIL